MPLSAGDKLGPYEIVAPLGAGGMGEVYRARDTRLDRTVAVKVLPEDISKRSDRRARFEREARTVASLNHPHICSLFDIGDQAGSSYMVMELIEGETLAARMEKGALPLDQAISLATQIADALDRTHRAGVTHRDIKPHNIMLTRDGVKILDFGLASSTAAKPGPADGTLTDTLTTEGTVMGTPQYMAPEQFACKEADARSDIWAFGAVLYEMLTGQKAFRGANYQSLVAAILATDPAPMAAQPFTPAWLERLVKRCLQKDPDDRYQSIRDVVLDLRTPPAEPVSRAGPASGKARFWPWVVVGVTLVSGAVTGWGISRSGQAPAPEQAYRSQLNPPDGGQFDLTRGFDLSPDGRSLAFIASVPGKSGLWVRPMDGTSARLLPGTEGARFPFWSPDSRSLAYHASSKLWRVDVVGGSPSAICDAATFVGGAWPAVEVIVFSTGTAGLRRVPATGGNSEQFTTVDFGRGEASHVSPQVLSGRQILFQVVGTPDVAGIYAISLANPKELARLVATTSGGVYAANHLLWMQGSTLLAQPFDPERFRLSGEPRPIADPVGSTPLNGMAAVASSTGLLVHARATGDQLSWLDRAGKISPFGGGTLGQPGNYVTFRISPDGRHVAAGRASSAGRDLWVAEVEREAWSRLTFLPGIAGFPVWSPDGRQIIFNAGSPQNLYRKEANGAGTEWRVTESTSLQVPTDWSRDGRLVLYYEIAPDTQRDLWVLPVTPAGQSVAGAKAWPYLRTRFNEVGGRFSPERRPGLGPRWVAYTSNESGRDEVYVQAFPEPRAKFQISTGGGAYPEWRADGQEIYYLSADGKLMAVEVKLGAESVAPSIPRELFALRLGLTAGASPYSVGPDGKLFLVLVPASGSQPLEVIVNWPALLKKGAAVQ